jgi:excinuclease ABC subunit B
LIQTIGRAARNVDGQVMIYADVLTESVKNAVNITNHRRKLQSEYNKKHGIVPRNTIRSLKDKKEEDKVDLKDFSDIEKMPKDELKLLISDLELDMKEAAKNLDFEKAANLRDQLMVLKGVSK